MLGVYFESWACPWVDSVEKCALAQIEAPVTHVFLSFCKPDCAYVKSNGTYNGTGLDFSVDFQIIRQSIQVLKRKGIKVILSVGGASYTNWAQWSPLSIALLGYDLEVDGWDLDYEPTTTFDADMLIRYIKIMKAYCVSGQTISIAGFAGGCFKPVEQPYRGTLIPVLEECKEILDFVNIMNYDAGSGWDYKKAYDSYKPYCKMISWGLQVGKQGWGDALLTEQQVLEWKAYKRPEDGFFIWAYFKEGAPNCQQVLKLLLTPEPPKSKLPKQVTLEIEGQKGVYLLQ